MSEWSYVAFKDIAEFNPRESIKKGEVAVKVGMDKLQPFCRDIPEIEYEEFSGGTKFRNGDTIMARITPCLENGKTAMVNVLKEGQVGFGSTEYIVYRAKPGITDPYFLYYLVCSPNVRGAAISSMTGTSGRQRVQTDVVENMELVIPELPEQKKIGYFLKKLDDKIAINNHINRNLSEQASAIVKNLVKNVTNKKTLKSICDSIGAGGTPSRKNEEYWNSNDYKWFKNGEIKNNILIDSEEYISKKGSDNSSAKPIDPYSILFAMYCVSKPQLAINTEICTTNQAVCVLKIKDFDLMCFIYFYMIDFGYDLTNLANGAAQQNLNKGLISDYEVFMPDIVSIKNSGLSEIIKQIISLEKESNKLSRLRDSLLPKLMSGELDISNLEI